ncbi:MAG: efflux RND transporter periplasmic adaptor subunit [Planctomycetia bacterium]
MQLRTKSRQPRRVSMAAILSLVASWGISLLTTASLVAVGWLGHATHWTFGLAGHAAPHAEHAGSGAEGASVDGPDDPSPGTVRFSSREALERTGIEVVPVERRPMVSELEVAGVVDYDERRTAQLSSRVGGSIWRVEKHLGDVVRKGEVLLVIDSQEVGRLKAEFLNALVTFESRREQMAILEEVQGAVMGRQLREARAALREARIHLVNDEQALVNLGLPVAIADYEALVDEARAERIRTVGLPEGLLTELNDDVVTSNLLPLAAPFDGIVVGRDAVVGEVVEAAKPIFEVADVSRMILALKVDKEDAGKVAIGQPVRFRPDGSDEEYFSRITWISTEVDQATRTLQVRAVVDNIQTLPAATQAGLRAHTFGSGKIEIDRRGTAIVVPSQSVQWDGSRWVVFVPTGDAAFTACEVQPGVREGNVVEIVGDPSGGVLERVVGAGSHVLKSQVLLERIESGEL